MKYFDTLAKYRECLAVGMTEEQAQVQVKTWAEVYDFTREDLATKNDLKVLELATKNDLKALETDLRADIKSLETDLRADIKSLETDLRADIKSLETDLRADIKSLDSDINSKFRVVYIMGSAIFTVACLPIIEKLLTKI